MGDGRVAAAQSRETAGTGGEAFGSENWKIEVEKKQGEAKICCIQKALEQKNKQKGWGGKGISRRRRLTRTARRCRQCDGRRRHETSRRQHGGDSENGPGENKHQRGVRFSSDVPGIIWWSK